ncbi:MAG: DNA topoisomerase subunit B [Clostridia bacterium]
MNSNYNADKIEVLEGLEAVRLRPGMYIGGTGNKGLHHILWEIIDNGIDEITNGFGNMVEVTLLSNNCVSVRDNGRGIPVDIHPKLKISGVEVVFTQLHAGGKFNNDSYSFSGGLHGVGASVTNALSEWLIVNVYKDGNEYTQSFQSVSVGNKIKAGVPVGSLKLVGKTERTGTLVNFKPDERIFKDEKFNFSIIASRLREIAFLNKNVTLTIDDQRSPEENGSGKKRTYHYEGGISDFVKYLNAEKDSLYTEPIHVTVLEKDIFIDVALQHTTSYTENVFSFVNNIPTSEGGTHEIGFKSACTKVFNNFAAKNNLIKDKKLPVLLGEDFREGLTAVISVKLKNVQFEGQTKAKLGNPEVRILVEQLVSQKLEEFLDLKSSKSIGESIINKALGAAKTRDAARRAKEIARQQKSINNATLVGKLASCTGKKAELNELFIVEGDSAGGSAKQGRDRNTQAILPLRGKPLNVEKATLDKILENEEFRTIISALGTGIGEDFTISDLKYFKIIILADADQDGGHIRSILLTFFFRYMRPLITEGHVFIGMPPLYKLSKKDHNVYCYNDAELEEQREILGRAYGLQRFKGLGEMNPEQLWDTTMNPNNRALTRVTIEDATEAEKSIATLMGDKSEPRKAYINEHANFNREDIFDKAGGSN